MLIEYRWPYWYAHCPVDDCLLSYGYELTPDFAGVVETMIGHIREAHADTPVYSLPTLEAQRRGLFDEVPA